MNSGFDIAISPRTILIRESGAEKVPFDISHLRYIEYTEDPGGMEALSGELKTRFSFYEMHPNKPDNQFLELCNFTDFIPEIYKNQKHTQKAATAELLSFVSSRPELLQTLLTSTSEEMQKKAFMQAISDDPSSVTPLIQAMIADGIV